MQVRNKLYFIDGKIGEKYFPTFGSRLDEIKYNRVRLGHSRFTNKFMPAGEDPLICIMGNKQMTIKHIFTNCKLHEEARKKFFGIHFNNIKVILNRNLQKMVSNVIPFLKYTQLYEEI